MIKILKVTPFKIISGVVVSSYVLKEWNNPQVGNACKELLEKFQPWKSPNNAKSDVNQSSNSTQNHNLTNKTENLQDGQIKKNDPKVRNEPPNNELRIILLGASGSGKSSAGNDLLTYDGFKTSSYAKSETKVSKLKTLEIEKGQKKYKIDIIDTPAANDAGLEEDATCEQIRKAIALSSPGPHAFIVCIPAPAMTKYYVTDVIEPYKKYFGDDIYDFIIVAYTRYDQVPNEKCNEKGESLRFINDLSHAIANNNPLKEIKEKTKDEIWITGKKDKIDNLELVIRIVDKTMNRMETSKKKCFASCNLSEYAEKRLQSITKKINDLDTIGDISRDQMKTSFTNLQHFICDYRSFFKEDK